MISNDLPSISSVFNHDMLGYMNEEGISWSSNPLYQHDDDDASPWTHQDFGHMEDPTTTTPTSREEDYKGNMGVDDENVPLVDLRICPIVACNIINPCPLNVLLAMMI